MKELKLALIGKDVSKSISPKVHKFIAARMGNSVSYENISVPEEEFERRIDRLIETLDGFNVTIPYKLSVIPHLKKIEGDGKIFGSVNTVTTRDLCGNNTDGIGFAMMLENSNIDVKCKDVLLLGAGGAGRSVSKKLLDAGAMVSVYDKTFDKACRLAHEFTGVVALKNLNTVSYNLIVNATGVGMHETEGQSPVGEKLLSLCKVAVDLAYVPAKSKFLEIAEGLGKKTVNGMGMLFYQAYYSECLYFGTQPDRLQALRLFEEFQKENRNEISLY